MWWLTQFPECRGFLKRKVKEFVSHYYLKDTEDDNKVQGEEDEATVNVDSLLYTPLNIQLGNWTIATLIVCVCVHVCVHVCVSLYVCMYVHPYICMSMDMYVSMYICDPVVHTVRVTRGQPCTKCCHIWSFHRKIRSTWILIRQIMKLVINQSWSWANFLTVQFYVVTMSSIYSFEAWINFEEVLKPTCSVK